MATDWEAEAKSIYEDYAEEELEIIIRLPGDEEWDETLGKKVKIAPDIDYKTFALRGSYSMFDLASSDIEVSDSKLFFSGYLLPEITSKYEIIANGKTLAIINPGPVSTAGYTYAYQAQVRGF